MKVLSRQEFAVKLRSELESRLTLDHPIITRLQNEPGTELIQLMVKQGYQLTKMFARYVGALYLNCPVKPELGIDRKKLAINLYEEETGAISKTDGHLQLMRRFAKAVGISKEELESAFSLPETRELIEYRWNLVINPETFHQGAAAIMIASEGQNLEKKADKMRHELFPAHLELTERDMAFFTVHAAEDVYHVKDGISLVSKICKTEQQQQEAIKAIHNTCDRFWAFYDSIDRVYSSPVAS